MRQPVRDTWDTSMGILPNLPPERALGEGCQNGAGNVPSVPRCPRLRLNMETGLLRDMPTEPTGGRPKSPSYEVNPRFFSGGAA